MRTYIIEAYINGEHHWTYQIPAHRTQDAINAVKSVYQTIGTQVPQIANSTIEYHPKGFVANG